MGNGNLWKVDGTLWQVNEAQLTSILTGLTAMESEWKSMAVNEAQLKLTLTGLNFP